MRSPAKKLDFSIYTNRVVELMTNINEVLQFWSVVDTVFVLISFQYPTYILLNNNNFPPLRKYFVQCWSFSLKLSHALSHFLKTDRDCLAMPRDFNSDSYTILSLLVALKSSSISFCRPTIVFGALRIFFISSSNRHISCIAETTILTTSATVLRSSPIISNTRG